MLPQDYIYVHQKVKIHPGCIHKVKQCALIKEWENTVEHKKTMSRIRPCKISLVRSKSSWGSTPQKFCNFYLHLSLEKNYPHNLTKYKTNSNSGIPIFQLFVERYNLS